MGSTPTRLTASNGARYHPLTERGEMTETEVRGPIGQVHAEGAIHAVTVHSNGRVSALCRVFRQGVQVLAKHATLDQVTCLACKKQMKKGRRPSIKTDPIPPHPDLEAEEQGEVEESPAKLILDRLRQIESALDQLEERLSEDHEVLMELKEAYAESSPQQRSWINRLLNVNQ